MHGFVTSSYFSATLDRSIALAMLKGGRARLGETVHCPLDDGSALAAEVVDPVFYDPDGRAAAWLTAWSSRGCRIAGSSTCACRRARNPRPPSRTRLAWRSRRPRAPTRPGADVAAYWLAPNEWLVAVAAGAEGELENRLRSALHGGAVVDVSAATAYNVRYSLPGRRRGSF